MYAVYVLAAILLSVAPMHATSVLAVLPSAALGQRANAARVVRCERIAGHDGRISQPACMRSAQRAMIELPALNQPASEPMGIRVASPVDAHLLANSPHAP